MGGFFFGLMLGMVLTLALEGVGIWFFVRNSRASIAHVLHACALALAGRPKAPQKAPEPVRARPENNGVPAAARPESPSADTIPARPNLLVPDGKADGRKGGRP
jgi:hypothetical protein